MGIYEGRGQLSKAVKDLTTRWIETKLVWDDAVSRRLEENFLVPMEMDLKSAIGAMDRVGVLIAALRRDCGEE